MLHHRNISQLQQILFLRRLLAYLLILRYLEFILHSLQEEKTEAIDAGTINVKAMGNRQGDKVKQPYTYTAREWDEEIGLYYYRARYYDSLRGRFISKDPIGFEGGAINLYVAVGNNPVRWVDPNGLAVTININRTTYTNNSIVGTISVASTVTNLTFSGYTLENRNPPNSNLPVPPYTYNAFIRTDHTPDRIELFDVPGAANIQIHVGNSAADVTGCFAVGETTLTDWVRSSTNAMNRINNIISADGSGNIVVIISGSTGRP